MAPNNSRRKFLVNGMMACLALPIPAAAMELAKTLKSSTRIGLITDLHQDIMHDAPQRLFSFIQAMKKKQPDALLQMGDFAYPAEKNKGVIESFRNAHPHTYHIIGNHDTDSGHTKDQCLSVWGMPSRYYSTTINGILLLVLDGNDKGSPTSKGGYPAYINEEQQQWLAAQLKAATQPVVIASHQPLAGPMAIDNALELQTIISNHKEKVLLCINGHTHIDAAYFVNELPYVHINSASYFWVGGDYKHESYDADVHLQYPWIANTCPYEAALYTMLNIHPEKGEIQISGNKSKWKGPSPAALGFGEKYGFDLSKEIAPSISKRNFKRKQA